VGSGQSISDALTALNTIIAESCDYIATKLETSLAAGKKLNASIQEVLGEIITQHGAVVFNGNGYAAEWHAEAEARRLPNYKTAVDAIPVLTQPDVVALFDKYKVLTPRELHGRYEIYLEQYSKTVNVEARLTAKIGKTIILPAALRYQGQLAGIAASVKSAGATADTSLLGQVSELIAKLQSSLGGLESATAHPGGEGGAFAEAKHFAVDVLPAMLTVREAADALEGVVADDLWPLPTYQEMLFIK
jgi:glutamine synthetase